MELRLYSFVNFYLSSIQQGIQTGHAAVDLVRKYTRNSTNPVKSRQQLMVEEWADNYKTFIVLNGGHNAAIHHAHDIISESDFPFISFYEDEASLDSLMTCTCIVVAEKIFNAFPEKTDDGIIYKYSNEDGLSITYDKSHPHYNLINLIRTARLAS